MSRAACLHADQARRQTLEECQHIFAPERSVRDDPAGEVYRVDLEDVLGQIKADGGYSIEISVSLSMDGAPSDECSTAAILARLSRG